MNKATNHNGANTMANYDNNNKGAGWWKKDKNNNHYQSGKVTINDQDYYLSIFKNVRKQKSNHPDFNVSVTIPKTQQQPPQQNQRFQNQQPQQGSNIEFQDFDQNTLGDSEVPF